MEMCSLFPVRPHHSPAQLLLTLWALQAGPLPGNTRDLQPGSLSWNKATACPARGSEL